MEETIAAETADNTTKRQVKESLLHRKYVVPFILACVILACTQLTGINSIIGYNATILIQAGLGDKAAHLGYVVLTLVNFAMTMVAVVLVDRKGRKFLLSVGSAGIIVFLLGVAALFYQTESRRVDCREAVQNMVVDQKLSVAFNSQQADKLLASAGEAGKAIGGRPSTMIVVYSYGDFRAATTAVRSDDIKPNIEVARAGFVPENKVVAFFANPFADLEAAKTAPLKIENALITPVPRWRTAG